MDSKLHTILNLIYRVCYASGLFVIKMVIRNRLWFMIKKQNNDNLIDHDYLDIVNVRNFIENVSYYITKYETQSIIKKLECTNCRKMSFVNNNLETIYKGSLVKKNRATLSNPCETVLQICLEA